MAEKTSRFAFYPVPPDLAARKEYLRKLDLRPWLGGRLEIQLDDGSVRDGVRFRGVIMSAAVMPDDHLVMELGGAEKQAGDEPWQPDSPELRLSILLIDQVTCSEAGVMTMTAPIVDQVLTFWPPD